MSVKGFDMKNHRTLLLCGAALLLGLLFSSCGPSTHVSVGVGVAVPGPWVGPYGPGGVVVVGRPYPYPGPYLPLQKGDDLELVKAEVPEQNASQGL